MKKEDLSQAMTELDESLIKETDVFRQKKPRKRPRIPAWI